MEDAYSTLTVFINNIMDFASSLPTTTLTIIIISIIMSFIGISIRDIIRTSIIGFIIFLILGSFGINLPSFTTIASFFSNMFNKLNSIVHSIFK